MTAKTIITIAKLLEKAENDLCEMQKEAEKEYRDDCDRIYLASENADLSESEIRKKYRELGSYGVYETVRTQHNDSMDALGEFLEHDWH